MRFTRSGLSREHREAQAAASVRHPNVALVFHLGESGGSYFYAMEFVEGETLENLIRRLGSLEPDVGLEVTAQVAAGLAAIQSPEQFSGIKTDIRSDLYSLGITLWEMLSGELPFQGSAVDLMHQHQRGALPIQKLQSAAARIVALLEVLLAKDPGERFQDPIRLQNALIKVKEAFAIQSEVLRASPTN